MTITPSTVSGEFPLTPGQGTEKAKAWGYDVTVAYSVAPIENDPGPPGGGPPDRDLSMRDGETDTY